MYGEILQEVEKSSTITAEHSQTYSRILFTTEESSGIKRTWASKGTQELARGKEQ